MSTFQERLAELIGGARMRSAFARKCGIPQSTMRDYVEGAVPGSDKMALIARAADVSVHWLSTGEGPRDIQPEVTLSLMGTEEEHMGRQLRQGEVLAEDDEGTIALPLLTIEGSAGPGIVPAREEIEDYLSVSRRYLREVGINPAFAHVLRLSGHSMMPTLLDKDLVIVDTSKNRLQDEEIYSVVFGDTVLIKRLIPLWDGSIRVTSDNKSGNYPDAIIPASDRGQLRIVGRACGFLRLF